ncbi:hypothetical protein SAMN05216357_10630 [Porphyromonadaceae bacterium KH3CP3RA]|nr:hypothetical protein SAMN05216357_10630 [Porphyromonadaceae bacterium KH3CP3RA]
MDIRRFFPYMQCQFMVETNEILFIVMTYGRRIPLYQVAHSTHAILRKILVYKYPYIYIQSMNISIFVNYINLKQWTLLYDFPFLIPFIKWSKVIIPWWTSKSNWETIGLLVCSTRVLTQILISSIILKKPLHVL